MHRRNEKSINLHSIAFNEKESEPGNDDDDGVGMQLWVLAGWMESDANRSWDDAAMGIVKLQVPYQVHLNIHT